MKLSAKLNAGPSVSINGSLEVPLYQLFYDGDKPPQLPNLLKRKTSDVIVWGSSGKDAIYLHKLRRCLSKAAERDRKILLSFDSKTG
jgi:hypothetical protein